MNKIKEGEFVVKKSGYGYVELEFSWEEMRTCVVFVKIPEKVSMK